MVKKECIPSFDESLEDIHVYPNLYAPLTDLHIHAQN